jgi:hypothetical protein
MYDLCRIPSSYAINNYVKTVDSFLLIEFGLSLAGLGPYHVVRVQVSHCEPRCLLSVITYGIHVYQATTSLPTFPTDKK